MAGRAAIRCAECGFENEPGHIYCARCKTKLNLDQISSKSFDLTPRRSITLQLLQFILLVLLICFTFALWPVPVETVPFTAKEFAGVKGKMQRLQQGALTEHMEFSEKEVNMLFTQFIQENRRRPSYSPGLVSLSSARVALEEGALTVSMFYQVGPLNVGPVELGPVFTSYEVTGRPEPGPSGLEFAALKGAMGHLPLPFLGGAIGKARLQELFEPFTNARVFLGRLEDIRLREGGVRVKYSRK